MECDIEISEKKLGDYIDEILSGSSECKTFNENVGIGDSESCEHIRECEIGNYGRMDFLIDDYSNKRLIILELKKGFLSLKSVWQISKYVQGLKLYLESRDVDGIEVIPILIGSGIKENERVGISGMSEFVKCVTYDISIRDGLSFKTENWSLSNPEFGAIPLPRLDIPF